MGCSQVSAVYDYSPLTTVIALRKLMPRDRDGSAPAVPVIQVIPAPVAVAPTPPTRPPGPPLVPPPLPPPEAPPTPIRTQIPIPDPASLAVRVPSPPQ